MILGTLYVQLSFRLDQPFSRSYSMRFASWYAILVGILLFIQWLFFLVTGQVPELETAPWEIGCHIAAEL